MITIKLNDYTYRYDIYQIFNLFFDFDDIKFTENNTDFSVFIDNDLLKINDSTTQVSVNLFSKDSKKEQIKRAVFSYLMDKIGGIQPWGILTGIRPSKIALSLINKDLNEEEIQKYYYEHFYTSKEKSKLCIEIAKFEKTVIKTSKDTVSLYLDMPFCPSRCLYCSFTSNPVGGAHKLVKKYIDTLVNEIIKTSEYIKEKGIKLQSIYFGGGTPTAIDGDEFDLILSKLSECFEIDSIKEFTVECGRPDSLDEFKLFSMKKHGVNRISINPQTMNDDTLKAIGRKHTVTDVIEKFKMARRSGFTNINMDLIVGLPGEGITHMERTCNEIRELGPDNITVHGLCVKRGSRLHEDIVLGKQIQKAKKEEIYAMYNKVYSLTEEMGMKPYYMYRQKNMLGNLENVGFSKKEKESIYNIQMIEEMQTIIGLGADAITKAVFLDENRIERHSNLKDVNEYVNRFDEQYSNKIKLLNTLYK